MWPPWPNGQGVGSLIRRLRVRVPQGVLCLWHSELSGVLAALERASLAWQVGLQGSALKATAPRLAQVPARHQIRGLLSEGPEVPRRASCRCQGALLVGASLTFAWTLWPPWPNGQGVGPLIRRLRARVPQGVLCLRHSELSGSLAVLGQAALDWQVGGQSTPLSPRAPEPVRAAVGLQIKGFFAGGSEAPRHVSCRCQTTLF